MFLKHSDVDYECLDRDELIILDKVITKFKNQNAQEIVDYMHEEIAYKETVPGEIISFDLTKKNREF